MIETDRRAALEFLRTRRSPKLRSLKGPAPSERELADILTIASRVPDHGKLIPWRFITIQGDQRGALNDVIGDCFDAKNEDATDAARSESRTRLAHAPLIVAVVFCPKHHPKVPEWEQILSVGAVCMNLLNAAKATGFAGLWLTEWYASEPRVLEELGITAGERIAGFIHIGRDDSPREDRVRPSLPSIVSEYRPATAPR